MSKRYGERLDAAKAARDAEAAAEKERGAKAEAAAEKRREEERTRVARIAPARNATAELRRAFWLCSDSEVAQDCNPPASRLEAACRKHGLRVVSWSSAKDECYGK